MIQYLFFSRYAYSLKAIQRFNRNPITDWVGVIFELGQLSYLMSTIRQWLKKLLSLFKLKYSFTGLQRASAQMPRSSLTVQVR